MHAERKRPGSWSENRKPRLEHLELRALLSVTTTDDTSIAAAFGPSAEELGVMPLGGTLEAIESSSGLAAAGPSSANGVAAAHSDHPDHAEDGVVTVTATEIITHHDIIPRFAAVPTISAVRSGAWSDPSTWSAGRVPTTNDRIAIGHGITVSYGIVSDVSLDALEISGSLIFSTTSSTRLTVGTIEVMPGGKLEIGTAAAPLAAQYTAEIVFADRPLNLPAIGQSGGDPRQFGIGLIAFGTVNLSGAVKTSTFTRMAAEARAGDTSILVTGAEAASWRPGETIVVPDTRQVRTTDDNNFPLGLVTPNWEEVVIDRVEGSRVYLRTALRFDHKGARDAAGNLQFLGHIAVLDRNIVLRSQNPQGTRGHTFFGGRAEIDIRYTRLKDLGRTDITPLNNSQFDSFGKPIWIGTNQVGRYAVHIHHLLGAENPTNTGYQLRFMGNTVDGSKRWAVALHDTNYGLVSSNVIYDAQGAGIVTEDGSEIGNEIVDNFALRIQGTHTDGKSGTFEQDYGRGGSGFWFRRTGNIVRGNVSADTTYAGYVFSSYYLTGQVLLPTARGVDKLDPGGGVSALNNPAGIFENNEAYGMSEYGLWMAFPSGVNTQADHPSILLKNLTLWHAGRSRTIAAYHTAKVTFDGLVIIGDPDAQDRPDVGTVGMDLVVYENYELVIRNSRIENMRTGILAPLNDASTVAGEVPTRIENTILNNYFNIIVGFSQQGMPSVGNSLIVSNVKFGAPLRVAAETERFSGRPYNIVMNYYTVNREVVIPSRVAVYNYNQVPGADFQVYYKEQAASFITPQTYAQTFGILGSPEAGLTNSQNTARYGISVAGSIAPTTDSTTRPEILGFTGPLAAAQRNATRISFVTPAAGEELQSSQVVLRYLLNGKLPSGSRVFFKLDNARDTVDPYGLGRGSFENVPDGIHTLRAYIGNSATKQQLAGTQATVFTFAVARLGTPTTLTAMVLSSTEGRISWADVMGEIGYLIEQSTDGRTWTTTSSVASNVTSLDVGGLSPGTKYFFRITTLSRNTQSLPSPVVSLTMPPLVAPPAAPKQLKAVIPAPGVISLTWSDLATNEQAYVIQRAINPETWQEIARLPANFTSYTDRPPAAGFRYMYRVRAVTDSGASAWASVIAPMLTATAGAATAPTTIELAASPVMNAPSPTTTTSTATPTSSSQTVAAKESTTGTTATTSTDALAVDYLMAITSMVLVDPPRGIPAVHRTW